MKDVKGHIFNIQRFSTHDGPGIRTTVFFKGCPLQCFWCQNPESHSIAPVLLHNWSICIGCGHCAACCPAGASRIEGSIAHFDRAKCTACGLCTAECPVGALSIAGYEVTVGEVMQQIQKDRIQYLNSGGGVTLSGGEVAVQPGFALALLKSCKNEGLHTLVETCGQAPWDVFESWLPYVDVFFWDIKKLDAAAHRAGTGADNRLILENAVRMARTGKTIRFRMPLIPGYNDTEEDVLALLEFVTRRAGRTGAEIDLLRYNSLGEDKFSRLDRAGPHLSPQSEEHMERLHALLTLCEGASRQAQPASKPGERRFNI